MKFWEKAQVLLLAVCLPVVYILLQIVFSLVGVLAVSAEWAQEHMTLLLCMAACSLLFMLVVAFRLAGSRLAYVSGFWAGAPADACLLAALAGITGNVVCTFLLPLVPFPQAWLLDYEEKVSALTMGGPVIQWLTVGLAVPVIEEILFRGLMLPTLERAFSARTALCLQAVFFAVFHWDRIQFLYVLAMAFLLGLAFQWSRSLRITLVMHIAFNCFSLAVVMPLENMPFYAYAASLAVLLCLLLTFMRALKRRYHQA